MDKRVTIEHCPKHNGAGWRKWNQIIVIRCGGCGVGILKDPLWTKIDNDGNISPAIHCKACGWKVRATLEGWGDS